MSRAALFPGKKAPSFALADQDGNIVRLKDFAGSWVVLYFYPKDNTPGCTTEAKDFTSKLPAFEKIGAVVLGVSPDSPESHCRFRKKHSLRVRLLSDPEKKMLQAYGAWGPKQLYGRTFEGVIRSTFLIAPDGRIAFWWPQIKVKGHALEVLAKLRELAQS